MSTHWQWAPVSRDQPLLLDIQGLGKDFRLHHQGGATIPVLRDISLRLYAGDCLVVDGPSGAGKSTLLRCLYGNYLAGSGKINVLHDRTMVDFTASEPRQKQQLRQRTMAYVSQFLRVIPRVSTLDLVMEPLLHQGQQRDQARYQAEALLTRLNVPETLWPLAPATFSGGEKQRINIARGFIGGQRILLLDEPTASLDAENRQVVIELIQGACQQGRAVIGIFHDAVTRDAVANRKLALPALGRAA